MISRENIIDNRKQLIENGTNCAALGFLNSFSRNVVNIRIVPELNVVICLYTSNNNLNDSCCDFCSAVNSRAFSFSLMISYFYEIFCHLCSRFFTPKSIRRFMVEAAASSEHKNRTLTILLKHFTVPFMAGLKFQTALGQAPYLVCRDLISDCDELDVEEYRASPRGDAMICGRFPRGR